MRMRVLLTLAFAMGAMTVSGCGEGERKIGGQGPPSSINQKANLSNPLNVVGSKGKPGLADRRSAVPQRLGR
jgi:hypothetical protein